jgi:hypothetical protein
MAHLAAPESPPKEAPPRRRQGRRYRQRSPRTTRANHKGSREMVQGDAP